MIPENNDELWAKNKSFGLLHSYILERVRGMESSGLTCYISNEQLAYETNTSISTISRAVKLLAEEELLWVTYHQEAVTNKQRIMRIFRPEIRTQSEQNDNVSASDCIPEIVELTPLDAHIDQLVNKRTLKKRKSISKDYDLDFDIDYISRESVASVDTDTNSIISASDDRDKRSLHDDKPMSIYEKSLLDLSYSERDEVLEDVKLGMIADNNIPHWVDLYLERHKKALAKMGCSQEEELTGMVRAVLHSNIIRELEDIFSQAS